MAVLDAVALDTRAVAKHFTDDTTRTGPDHGFSIDPITWRAMIDNTGLIETALVDGLKEFEENEP